MIRSGQRVFVHGGAAPPGVLLNALVNDTARLRDVELVHLHTAGKARYADAEFAAHFRVVNLFVGESVRKHLDRDRVDHLPCFLSELPMLVRNKLRPLDVALISVSPPDKHGNCTLGTSVDVALAAVDSAAVDSAAVVIAQVNKQMPRVPGDGVVHLSEVDAFVDVDVPLPESPPTPATPREGAVGRNVARLIEDGATLQMGIGTIPDAVCRALHGHRHLGIPTEVWSDGALDLILSGAVDNSQKKIHRGRTVSGVVTGTRRLFDCIDDNPDVLRLDITDVNNPTVIARNPRVCAINSAVELDLTGQVCADSVGPRVISGVGGQMDLLRGAALSEGGKPILAITSRTRSGRSRLVPQLTTGVGVVTTRAHVHYVVTEHGAADLFGKTLGARAAALIRVAHPDDREALAKAWHDGAASIGGRRRSSAWRHRGLVGDDGAAGGRYVRGVPRIHAPELEDQPWCPVVVRDGLTAFLHTAAETLRVYDAVTPTLRDVVARHGAPRLIDLCSGGGGPVLRLQRALRDDGVGVDVVLTDLYPNHGAFDAAGARGQGTVTAVLHPVDATDVPDGLVGVRTMFNALHHLRPNAARRVLADAARKRQPLVVVEVVDRRPSTFAFLCGTPLAALLLAPLQRPLSPARLALTWGVPVIPAAVWWDGMMSCLRAYGDDELAALTAGLDDDDYGFVVQRAAVPFTPLRLTILVGEPRAAREERAGVPAAGHAARSP